MLTPEVTSLRAKKNTHEIFNQDGNDITPKPLIHDNYSILYDKNITYLDSIISRQKTNTANLIKCSSKDDRSSFSLIKSTSLYTGILDSDKMESFIFLSGANSRVGSTDQASLPYHPPESCNHGTIHKCLKCSYFTKKKKTLVESRTTFIFKLLQLTEDSNISEGVVVKEAKDRYQYLKPKVEFMKTVTDAATQTLDILIKSRFTFLAKSKMIDRENFTSNWIMYNTCNNAELAKKTNGLIYEEISKEIVRCKESQNRLKFSKLSNDIKIKEDQMTRLYKNLLFATAVRAMDRLICTKLHSTAQKCFRGLIKTNPYDLDSKITYSLNYLWSYIHMNIRDRLINCIRWNHTNFNLLAVAYGKNSIELSGYLLIWNTKHPLQPERFYRLDFAISDIDWSRKKPNQLAVGCCNGTLKIIDISKKTLAILCIISQESLFTFSHIWQVQWWLDDDHEYIYMSNGDGKIYRCQANDDLAAVEMMRTLRVDDSPTEIKQNNNYTLRILNMPIRNEPEAILLRRHPIFNNMYLIGSDEGCIYRCSTTYSSHYIDSFLAHDGPICSLEYSPFCSKIFLTTGADWCTRIWADGVSSPLITLSTQISYVTAAAWSPKNSTIIATCVKNTICIWDIKQNTQKPKSVRVLENFQQLVSLCFTPSGQQIVVADTKGFIHVYNCEGMPFMPFNQTDMLVESIKKSVMTKPNLLQRLQKLGKPF